MSFRTRYLPEARVRRKEWERAASVIGPELAGGRGVRLGQSAVLSRRVHVVSSARPSEVRVVVDADAGQVFYGRAVPHQIIHLDVFHEVAQIDHRAVARACLRAIEAYLQDFGPGGLDFMAKVGRVVVPGRMSDCLDVQTATGGGRATGLLTYGRKESLRMAHLTHAHLAMQLDSRHLPLAFYFVAAVEGVIQEAGREIRMIEKIVHERGSGGDQVDLSNYSDFTDSILKEPRPPGGQAEGGRMSREGGAVGPNPPLAPPRGDLDDEAEAQLRRVAELTEDFGTVEELQAVLEAIAEQKQWQDLAMQLDRMENGSGLVRQLQRRNLISEGHPGLRLTGEGEKLQQYLRYRCREIDLRLRQSVRRRPLNPQPLRKMCFDGGHPVRQGSGRIHSVVPADRETWLTDISVTDTVIAAAKRARTEGRRDLVIERSDVRVIERVRFLPIDLCLLIDASASMAGKRLRAARFLAAHLLLSTRDRVAVIVFQERDSQLWVPFTRNFAEAQASLSKIQPLGLTPLAHGLMGAAEYMRQSRVRNPLLVLITDGIPTIPKWTIDPMNDALEAARRVGRAGLQFACIGLEPNRRHLQELAEVARGTLYVVDELEKETMVRIVREERQKRMTDARTLARS
ncbi:MAG TPA: VWA domain-containing protein [Bacillota bacterium]|jgi:magnesium chelatase subunit D